MADDNQVTGDDSAVKDDNVVLNVSDEVQQNFADLVEMIETSESMNIEERQYWVDALPIMSEDQITNLRNILLNEREQIAQANSNYESETQEEVKHFNLEFDANKYREKKEMWKKMEQEHETVEVQDEAKLLAEIEALEL